MRFDLTDLRLFVNVHEAGTLTGGAEATHMTLASASERVRGMEEALGTPLLVRERRGVQPTPAGRTLLHHARLMLGQLERLQGELGRYGSGLKGHVRMLCNTSALDEHLPQVLSSFLATHPGLSIDLEERTSGDIVDALRHEVCEIGMVSDAADLEGLECWPFRRDPLVLVVPREHALASRASVGLADVLDAAFVGLAEGSALQDHIAGHARRLGRRLDYRIRLRGFDSVCRMVGLGIGIAIVPQAVAVRCGRAAKLRRLALAEPWADRRLMVAVRRREALAPHAALLVDHLLKAAAG